MTIKSSGPLGISEIMAEGQIAAGTSTGLSFINSYTKPSLRSASPRIGQYYNYAYFQNNNEGNCNNTNCTVVNCNCGDRNCSNCLNLAINCVNCDQQKWLQPNCNCNCTYNCDQTTRSFNCNCHNCDCLFSDDTVKNRQGNIENPLDLINQLNGFFYTGNQKASDFGLKMERDVGVSAQEVEKTLPEALGSNIAFGQIKTVRYERLIPLLIEAVKALDQKVNSITK